MHAKSSAEIVRALREYIRSMAVNQYQLCGYSDVVQKELPRILKKHFGNIGNATGLIASLDELIYDDLTSISPVEVFLFSAFTVIG